MHKRVGAQGEPFTTLVRTYPYGTDPSILPTRPGQPLPLRNTITSQVILTDKGATTNNARMTPASPLPIVPSVGVFTVATNNFTTGRAAILLGDYVLVSGIDFDVGVDAATTATNIATAISLLSGFSSTSLGPVVGVGYDTGPADVVEFRAVHYGTVVNFTPFNPANGEMHTGSPLVGPPLIA